MSGLVHDGTGTDVSFPSSRFLYPFLPDKAERETQTRLAWLMEINLIFIYFSENKRKAVENDRKRLKA